ncbi:hypothetical protein, partial [Athalassotoga sp.]|uniref:hypothetical protein n=1 Tax=Athalassotoga sp. TaxID=2022597 RepID=UPI003D020E6C
MKSVLIYDLKDTYDMLKKGINMVESGEYLNLIEEAKKVRELFKPDNFVEEISKMIKNEG